MAGDAALLSLLFGLQASLTAMAVLSAGTGHGRRIAAGSFVVGTAALAWWAPAGPLPRVFLASFTLLALIGVTEVILARGVWSPAQRLRLVFLFAHPDQVRSTQARVSGRLLLRLLVASIVIATCLLALAGIAGTSSMGLTRLALGTLAFYAAMELLSDLTCFIGLVFGLEIPPNQLLPIRSRSLQEFWGRRWNRYVAGWLRRMAFQPLARRRHSALGISCAFLLSAAIHAWQASVALDWQSTLLLSLYFPLQGACTLIELRLHIARWPPAMAHAWTLAILLLPSPLVTDPFLRILGL